MFKNNTKIHKFRQHIAHINDSIAKAKKRNGEFKVLDDTQPDQKNIEPVAPGIKAISSNHKSEKGFHNLEKDIIYNIDSNSIRVVLDEAYFNSLEIVSKSVSSFSITIKSLFVSYISSVLAK